MTQDQSYMYRCLQLAENGRGSVAPNPMVGAILVHGDMIIGEGWTQAYGGAHAEVHCIGNVKRESQHLISESSLYVSLEPCSHFGKTPPCVDLIISKKIKKVVIGCKDVAAHVNGAGIQKLLAAGIEVVFPVLEKECIDFNKRFFTYQEKKRPYIVLKWAQSADGFISATGEQTKITEPEIDVLVHKWRTEEAAIMVGTNTALTDDPSLTARHWKGKQPVRIVIDKSLTIDPTFKIFDQSSTSIILNSTVEAESDNIKRWKIEGKGEQFLAECLGRLYKQSILSVLVEGGAQLLQSFIDQNLWDEMRIITNKEMNIVDGLRAPIYSVGIAAKELDAAKHNIKFYQNK